MSQEIYLQQLPGTDKRNPVFTISRNAETKHLHVYYGGDLFETIPDNRADPQYKIMVARLYNAGVNAVKLKSAFGADRKTMRRWGDALKCGDNEKLVHVLQGRQANRKLTPEIRAFIRIRFPYIYERNIFSYSKEIRAEIVDAYNVHLCSETIRPLLKELKSQFHKAKVSEYDKRETDCEYTHTEETINDAKTVVSPSITEKYNTEELPCNRNESPVSKVSSTSNIRLINHLGVLIFSSILQEVSKLELLIKQEYRCLDTAQKRIMDALKLIARNSFYQTMQPFKKKYNNYRDDHVLFRNLTHANGIMISSRNMVEIQLFPTAHYTPALQNIINGILNKFNEQNPLLPDGSGRRISFCLGNKEGIELANVNPVFNHNT